MPKIWGRRRRFARAKRPPAARVSKAGLAPAGLLGGGVFGCVSRSDDHGAGIVGQRGESRAPAHDTPGARDMRSPELWEAGAGAVGKAEERAPAAGWRR